jgi:hypothetical protein
MAGTGGVWGFKNSSSPWLVAGDNLTPVLHHRGQLQELK